MGFGSTIFHGVVGEILVYFPELGYAHDGVQDGPLPVINGVITLINSLIFKLVAAVIAHLVVPEHFFWGGTCCTLTV